MYNSLSNLPFIPYRIIEHLALKDEVIWKLLKYNDYNALKNPELSFKEKMNLIWKSGDLQEPYNVFLTNLVEDAIPVSKTILKIYQYYIQPKDLYLSSVVYAFDILFGGKMSLVEYEGVPVLRSDLIIHRLLTILNGSNVNGVGKMTFIDDLSRYSGGKSIIGNNKTFTGASFYIGVNVGDKGVEQGCGI